MTDVLRRVRELLPELSPVVAGRVESAVRRDWGGERPYVGKAGEVGRHALTERDRAIQRDSARGEHTALLSRRYQISPRRIQQILLKRGP